MLRKLVAGTFALFVTASVEARVAAEDVGIEVEVAPGSAPLVAEVATRTVENGRALLIEMHVANRSDRPATLRRATARFPWLRGSDGVSQVACGGTEMGDQRPQVRTPGASDIRSGAYLLARGTTKSRLLGFVTWNRFWTKLELKQNEVTVLSDGEDRFVRPGETVALETIWLADDAHWQDLLFSYADAIAASTGARPKRPMKYVGWGTWDYFGRNWSHEDVIANAKALKRLVPEANLLQIDGGWWPYRGDYFSLRRSLPADSLKTLASFAKSQGLVAGLHLDGMRGDINSKVATEHPDYFLHDQDGEFFTLPQANDGDQLEHVYFDFSNPAACEYMRRAVAGMRRDWGFDYLKIDFLRFGIAEKMLNVTRRYGPDGRTIQPFDRGLTSVERIRRGMQAFREGMGEDAYFLGCSAIFGLTFGFVDGLRTGDDVYPEYPHFQRLALENGGNFYLHGRVVYNDADYHIARGASDQDKRRVQNKRKDSKLTVNEAEMWTHYVGLFGGPKINSDDLTILGEERANLFRTAVELPLCDRFVPIDLWQHGTTGHDAPTVFVGEASGRVYLAIFNWTDASRTAQLSGVAPSEAGIERIGGSGDVSADAHRLQVTLAGRLSAVLRLPVGTDFDTTRRALDVTWTTASGASR